MPSALEEGAPLPEGGTPRQRRYLGGLPGDYAATPGRRGFPLPPVLNDALSQGATLDQRHDRGAGGYVDGDQYAYLNASPETIARLQRDLLAGGLIPPKRTYTIGRFDAVTEEAYTNLLAYANAAGKTDQQALAGFKAAPIVEPVEPEKERPKRAPLVKELPNPENLKVVLRDGLRRHLGYRVDDATLARLAAVMQGEESARQEQQYAMGGTFADTDDDVGGTVVDPLGMDALVEREARAIDPVKVDARRLVGKFDMLVGMLGEGGLLQTGGGAP